MDGDIVFATEREAWIYTGHNDRVRDTELSSDGNYLYSADDGGDIHKINTSDFTNEWVYKW